MDLQVNEVEKIARRLLDAAGFELEPHGTATASGVMLELSGPDDELVLQRRAELLSALQIVLRKMLKLGEETTLTVDCRNFRTLRDKELHEIALWTAQKVEKTGQAIVLSPMDAWERRTVHLALADHPTVETQSQGDGLLKNVCVQPRKNTTK